MIQRSIPMETPRRGALLLGAMGLGLAFSIAWLTADLPWQAGAAALGLVLALVVGVSKTSSA